MSLILRVGDPHFRPENLEESERLMSFVRSTAQIELVNAIEFAGDVHHTHAVMRMEVIDFCLRWFSDLAKDFRVRSLVGNHDQAGDRERENSLNSLSYLSLIDNVDIIRSPIQLGDTLYAPYTSSHETFIKWVTASNAKYLFCHQTFNGSQYENGFYAKDGLDPAYVAHFKKVISGHIHKHQEFANILYIGTAGWDSVSYANQDKFLWLFDGGEVVKKIPIPPSVCQPIVSYDIYEGEDLPLIPEGARAHVVLNGKTSWITEQLKALKGKARVTAKPTDTKKAPETAFRLKSLESYLEGFSLQSDVSKEDLFAFLKEVE